ncbi:hypothetical protein [Pantoea ananatis]|uniref:hypothetical protein n=1 Tax=Pantoea ananas TaxID=553 RepID=UPI0021F7A744|nr:hypothetical protein [Pantoea ananatis]
MAAQQNLQLASGYIQRGTYRTDKPFMYVRLSAGHLPQGDAAMFALFSGFILIICLAFEALLIRDYPRLRYGLRLMMALLSGCMTLALWLQAGVRA